MQRYFISQEQLNRDQARIIGEDAHHLVNVMRAKPGETIIVCDGQGQEAIVKLTTLAKSEVVGDVIELRRAQSEPKVRITVAQAMPKGDKMETVIQKGTEVGAVRFIPFTSERTIVQYDAKKEGKRLERWGKIAKEAAEQAHRGAIPELSQVASWKELLVAAGQADIAFLCYEKESSLRLREHLARLKTKALDNPNIMLIVGPEGGFSEKEVREAEDAGCLTISLGQRILRTETAALVGLSCILYEYGEIGG